MSAGDTRALIRQALEGLQKEVPALARLKLVIRLELRGAAARDMPIWRVEMPGPKIDRDPAGDARIDVSVARSTISTSLPPRAGSSTGSGRLTSTGHVRVSGDPAVTKLLGNVIQRQLARQRA